MGKRKRTNKPVPKHPVTFSEDESQVLSGISRMIKVLGLDKKVRLHVISTIAVLELLREQNEDKQFVTHAYRLAVLDRFKIEWPQGSEGFFSKVSSKKRRLKEEGDWFEKSDLIIFSEEELEIFTEIRKIPFSFSGSEKELNPISYAIAAFELRRQKEEAGFKPSLYQKAVLTYLGIGSFYYQRMSKRIARAKMKIERFFTQFDASLKELSVSLHEVFALMNSFVQREVSLESSQFDSVNTLFFGGYGEEVQEKGGALFAFDGFKRNLDKVQTLSVYLPITRDVKKIAFAKSVCDELKRRWDDWPSELRIFLILGGKEKLVTFMRKTHELYRQSEELFHDISAQRGELGYSTSFSLSL